MPVLVHDLLVLFVMTCCVRELACWKLTSAADMEKAASPPCQVSTFGKVCPELYFPPQVL